MKTLYKTLTIAALMISGNAFSQQDIHFSQFYSAPTFINPGTTGVFNGNIRGMMNYRSQWKSITTPFTTISAAFDARLFQDKLKSGFFGAGLVFYNDKAGDSKLTTGNYAVNLSYAIEVSEDMYLSVGVQPGLLQKSISYNDLYFENQFNGLTFDNAVPNGEGTGSQKFMTFDLGAGVYYTYRMSDENAIYAGVSAAHLTSPNISFLGGNDNLLRKYTVHGGAEIALSGTNMTFLPNALVKFQGPNRIINFGTDVKYILQQQSHYTGFVNELSFGLGAYYRVGDAFWGTAQFNWTGFTLAFSYDLNLSDLSVATTGKGGMEMMLMYRAGIGNGKGKSTRFL